MSGVAGLQPYCIGYGQVYGGMEGPQITDDAHFALYFKSLIEKNDEFDFKFGFYSYFNHETSPEGLEQIVSSTNLKMRLNNWSDFIVYKSQQGWDLSNIDPENFSGAHHGDSMNKFPHFAGQGVDELLVSKVIEDSLGDISSVEFLSVNELDITSDSMAGAPQFNDSNTTRIIGMRTSKDCY